MNPVSKELTVTIAVTPKTLREAATFIEEQMETRTVGQEVPSYLFFGDEVRVKLQADQSAYHNHKSGNKSAWV
jgi:hypothetical protein